MPPIVGAYERPLSLTTMTRLRSLSSEMLLSASHVMPPVSAPSPTTATTCRSLRPVRVKAREMPSAQLQRARRVRGLDDVVRALGALRVAGEAAARAQPGEVLTARQQLVHVGLVPGVEDDRVARRVEDAVQRDRQLDDAEIRAEVPAGAGDVLDEELADLRGELARAARCSARRGRGARDRRQQRHPSTPLRRAVVARARKSTRARGRGGRSRAAIATRPLVRSRQTSERSTYCRMPPLR